MNCTVGIFSASLSDTRSVFVRVNLFAEIELMFEVNEMLRQLMFAFQQFSDAGIKRVVIVGFCDDDLSISKLFFQVTDSGYIRSNLIKKEKGRS